MQPRNQGLCGSLRLLSSLARRRPHDAVESRFSNAVHVRASTVTWCVCALRVWRVLRLSQNERAGQYRTLTSHAQRRLWTPPLSLRVVVVLAFAFRIRPGTRRRRFSRWLCEPSGAKFSVMRRDNIYTQTQAQITWRRKTLAREGRTVGMPCRCPHRWTEGSGRPVVIDDDTSFHH